MKNYFKYLISVFILTSFVISQVTEGMVEFKLGKHNALQLILMNVDKKLVESEWKYYTKTIGKSKKKKGEYIIMSVNLSGLSNPVDWYMKLDKRKANILLQLCVISNEEFLSSSNQIDNFRVIEKYLEDFVFIVEKAKVRAEYEKERKVLTKLQKGLKILSEDYDSNIKSIEKHTKKIEKAKKENKSLLKTQIKTKDEIAKQGLVVEGILNNPSDSINEGEVSPEYEEANKKLLKLQKKLEKLINQYKNNLKSIDKSIKKIEKAKKENKSFLKDQTKTKKKISEQGRIVEELRKLLESMN